MQTKDIVIDGDIIIHLVCKANVYDSNFEDAKELNNAKIDMKVYKKHFKQIVADWVGIAEVESVFYKYKIGKTKVILSGKSNFRYDIFPEYKAKRKPSEGVMKKLKKWARKYYTEAVGCEADDVIAYYVRKGALGFSFDKDLIYGVAGRWFDVHHSRNTWHTTTKKEAEHFFKCQILAGDGVDGIPSIKGVGLKTAEKLLSEHGDSYDDIVSIFEAKGYTKEYMITMSRLVSMSQWSPKKGIVLWEL